MKKITYAALLCAILLFLAGCTAKPKAASSSPPVTSPAVATETAFPSPTQEPENAVEESAGLLNRFSTTDLYGAPVDQTLLKGHRLTMVNVWATYCSPCLQEMPDLGELAAEYRDQGVQIIGLVADVLDSDGSLSDKQIKTAQDVVAATKANYPHLLPSQDLFGILYQVSALPTTFFVDENGQQVGFAYLGAKSKDAWADIIEDTLAEVSP